MNRFEMKFVVDRILAQKLIETTEGLLRPDSNMQGSSSYRVSSIYFDDRSLSSFFEKVEGLRFRRKVRLRVYGNQPETGYLEIKQRIDRTVQKRRVPLTMQQIHQFQREPWAFAPEDPVAEEAVFLLKVQQMLPKIMVWYDRQAFVGIYEPGLRVTLDTGLFANTRHLQLPGIGRRGTVVLSDRLGILEVKFDSSVPRWLLHVLNRHGLMVERVSKYCSGMNSAFFGRTAF